jgi:ABC-type multidrug transport system ATPase subunit
MHLMKKSFVGGDEIEESFQNAVRKERPVKLSWHDLHYSVTLPKDKKTGEVKELKIIKGVTGYALPGQTLYIMGASGAGKTTLLNLISDRSKTDGKHFKKGKVLVNNSTEVTQKSFGSLAAFVMQDDILFDYLQVKEALTFAARLRLPNLSREQQDQRVEKILKDLGLTNVQDTQIGSPFRKIISGGERKRTAIGVELITDPRVILLDEPTSGLDSFKAHSIAKLLRKLARQEGKTIISTIH